MKAEYLIERTMHNCGMHINSELEIVYVKSGEVVIRTEAGEECIGKGEAFLIYPYHLHGFSCGEDTLATVFMFSYSIAEDFCDRYKGKKLFLHKFAISEETAAFVEYSRKLLKNNDGCVFKSIFYAFAAELLKSCFLKSAKETRPFSMQEVLEYIYVHLQEELTIKRLSTMFGVHQTVLAGFFRDKIGLTFGEFIKNVRIERAKALLQKNEMTVTEIAYECGFGCVRSFNRAFLKCLKMTPSEYKKGF